MLIFNLLQNIKDIAPRLKGIVYFIRNLPLDVKFIFAGIKKPRESPILKGFAGVLFVV